MQESCSNMKIAMLGAGAWGTAMAQSAAPRHEVTLWSISAQEIAALQHDGENVRFLPGIPLSNRLTMTSDLHAATAQADLVVIATPMAALREMLQKLHGMALKVPVICLSKGIETPQPGTQIGLLGHQVAQQVIPDFVKNIGFGVLSGPSFAKEVALGLPTAVVAASEHASVCQLAIDAFHSERLRVYRSDDPIGVEVGGAVKNVLAIATGLVDGLHLGMNARAGLITRGLAEMARLGVALGAQAQTFMGLSGLGDLVLTATGDLSRNRRVGLELAQGKSLEHILQTLGHVAEGVYSARSVVMAAQHLGVEMPISQAVVALLDGQSTAQEVLNQLMHRDAKAEWGVDSEFT